MRSLFITSTLRSVFLLWRRPGVAPKLFVTSQIVLVGPASSSGVRLPHNEAQAFNWRNNKKL